MAIRAAPDWISRAQGMQHATEKYATSGKAPQLSPGPRVIHKHDGLAPMFFHLQHKQRELLEANESREWALVSDAPKGHTTKMDG